MLHLQIRRKPLPLVHQAGKRIVAGLLFCHQPRQFLIIGCGGFFFDWAELLLLFNLALQRADLLLQHLTAGGRFALAPFWAFPAREPRGLLFL